MSFVGNSINKMTDFAARGFLESSKQVLNELCQENNLNETQAKAIEGKITQLFMEQNPGQSVVKAREEILVICDFTKSGQEEQDADAEIAMLKAQLAELSSSSDDDNLDVEIAMLEAQLAESSSNEEISDLDAEIATARSLLDPFQKPELNIIEFYSKNFNLEMNPISYSEYEIPRKHFEFCPSPCLLIAENALTYRDIFQKCLAECDFKSIRSSACVSKQWNQNSQIFWKVCDLSEREELIIVDAKAQNSFVTDEPLADSFSILKSQAELSPFIADPKKVMILTIVKNATLRSFNCGIENLKSLSNRELAYFYADNKETYRIFVTATPFLETGGKILTDKKNILARSSVQMPSLLECMTFLKFMPQSIDLGGNYLCRDNILVQIQGPCRPLAVHFSIVNNLPSFKIVQLNSPDVVNAKVLGVRKFVESKEDKLV